MIRIALALSLFLFLCAIVKAQEQLSKDLQELNQITGEVAVKNKIRTLISKDTVAKEMILKGKNALEKKQGSLNGNGLWILARVAQEIKDYSSAEAFYGAYVKEAMALGSGQKISSGYGALIQILFDTKKYHECEKACNDFLDITLEDEASFMAVLRLKPVVFRRLVLCQSKLGQADKGLEKVDKLIKDQPDNWLNLELKGRILREIGRAEDAEKTYEALIEKIKTDKRLGKEEKEDFVEEVNYTLSNVYIDLKKVNKATEVLEKLLEKNPENPTYLNDLGYVLADNNLRLEDAEKMVKKAIELERQQRKKIKGLKPDDDRDNSAYLDSLAWVYFKQKKFEEAKKLLLEAVKDEEGRHIEILDHLADVHEALGEKQNALKVWKEGLEVVTPSKRDQDKKSEVEKKIKRLTGQ